MLRDWVRSIKEMKMCRVKDVGDASGVGRLDWRLRHGPICMSFHGLRHNRTPGGVDGATGGVRSNCSDLSSRFPQLHGAKANVR